MANQITVLAFDADPQAESPMAPYPVEYRTQALSDTSRGQTLYVTRNPGCSSLYPPNRDLVDRFPDATRFDVVKEIALKTQPLASLGVAPDFLKLDTQGSELDILKGANLSNALGVEIEVEFAPLYTGQPLFADVDSWLAEKGFVLADLSRNYWRRLNGSWQLIFGDALYLRDRSSLAAGQHGKLDAIEQTYGYRRPRHFIRGALRISRWFAQFTHKGWYHGDDRLGP